MFFPSRSVLVLASRKRLTRFLPHVRMYIGVMVQSVFAKITDAKRFLCFLMIKNTPAERESPYDNDKSLRSTTSITTVAAAAASTNATKAAQTFVVIPGTFPSSWGVFYRYKT